MPRFLTDTSCTLAAVSGWHEHHEAAARAINSRLAEGHTMLVAAPSLVEAYSVLTRLPQPHRLSPANALVVIEESLADAGAELIALEAGHYRRLLYMARDRGIAGGALYDAVIMGCAEAGGADTVLTFNARHFQQLAIAGIQVVVPA